MPDWILAAAIMLAQVAPVPATGAAANPFDQFNARKEKSEGGARLLVLNSNGGIAIIDYATPARCENARHEIEIARKNEASRAQERAAQQGAIITKFGSIPSAYCIPDA